jgi:hypothetical protein
MRGAVGRPQMTRRRRTVLGGCVSVILVSTALLLAVVGGHDGGSGPSSEAAPPHLVGPRELVEVEESLGYPIYWAGPRRATGLELSLEGDGSAFVRYLPDGVDVGDPRPSFLVVGSYPIADAAAALRRTAKKEGVDVAAGPGASVLVERPSAPGSVYLAYPGTAVEVEVFSPRKGEARRLVESGAIEAVGG